MAPESSLVNRAKPIEQLAWAIHCARNPERPEVVLVLGEEGVGKTWAVAQYWLECEPHACFIFISARDVRDGQSPKDIPLVALNRALPEMSSDAIEKRLRYLLTHDGRKTRSPLIVVLDGLNENVGVNWAEQLVGLHNLLEKAGGTLIATCRPRAWHADYSERIGIGTSQVDIHGYSNDELRQFVAAKGRSLDDFPEDIRAGLRNPRFCTLAMQLVDKVGVNALTQDRVLWEYWRERLKENQGLKHGSEDFNDVLREHARAMLRTAGLGKLNRLRSPTFAVREIGKYSPLDLDLLRSDLPQGHAADLTGDPP